MGRDAAFRVSRARSGDIWRKRKRGTPRLYADLLTVLAHKRVQYFEHSSHSLQWGIRTIYVV
jgi:hypothetical protein